MKNNYIYLYNNTFISLLNLIKELVSKKQVPFNIKDINYTPSLLDEVITLDIEEDDSIIKEIINKVGIQIFNIIYYIYLSNDKNKEIIIYYFFVYSLKYQDKVIFMRNLKSVSAALKISHYVSRENHKFKGFLRFKELENDILYAEFAPENNIIFILSKHFKNRLKNEYWIIKDIKRNIISIYDKKEFYIVNADDFKLHISTVSNNEKNIEELWKDFYKTIGIKERHNERCRMNFMPKKYWKYITEVSEEYEKSSK